MTTTGTRPAEPAGIGAVRRPRRLRVLGLTVLVLVVLGLMCVSVAVGTRDVGWDAIVAALGGSAEGFDEAAVAKRVPRTLLAVLAGAALGVAGAVMQGVTRNPIADPGILGVNMGASLAVVVGMASFGLASATHFVWAAVVGGGITAVFVYVIGSLGRGGATPLKLALAGTAVSAALASFISAIVLPRNDIAGGVRSWQIGGVGGATYDSLTQVLPFLLVGFALCLACARGLDMLALGDDLAAGLGERVALARGGASLGAVALCGAATAVTGPIAFVGLVVPHVCRLLTGPGHRWLIPFSALGGAALLTAADVVGRIVARPAQIDVGIVTALIGAPFFIHIVRRQKVRSL
ncbi:iron ABC transporter permease [Nocardiopsis alba]|uniref:FecCD family ABC transporter permease n=1 Tax=Nocardiopsis alba TaxID=53437 RepID=UPI0033CD0EAF